MTSVALTNDDLDGDVMSTSSSDKNLFYARELSSKNEKLRSKIGQCMKKSWAMMQKKWVNDAKKRVDSAKMEWKIVILCSYAMKIWPNATKNETKIDNLRPKNEFMTQKMTQLRPKNEFLTQKSGPIAQKSSKKSLIDT